MSSPAWAVVLSLLLGSVRAAQLIRVSTSVEAVNAVVLTTLARGRGRELGHVLGRAGAALYLEVARTITEPLDKLWISDRDELRRRLERDATEALRQASQRLGRFGWLNAGALAAIAWSGVSAMTGRVPPSSKVAVGLFAATLLWLSNTYGARRLATRMVAGALALVDSLVEGAEELRSQHDTEAAPPEE